MIKYNCSYGRKFASGLGNEDLSSLGGLMSVFDKMCVIWGVPSLNVDIRRNSSVYLHIERFVKAK